MLNKIKDKMVYYRILVDSFIKNIKLYFKYKKLCKILRLSNESAKKIDLKFDITDDSMCNELKIMELEDMLDLDMVVEEW